MTRMTYAIYCSLLLCMLGRDAGANMASPPVSELWLAAESLPVEDALPHWNAIYQQLQSGDNMPAWGSQRVLVLNMIQSALQSNAVSLAYDYVAALADPQERAYMRLVIARYDSVNNNASNNAIIASYKRDLTYFNGDDRYHWRNAVITAMFDALYAQQASDVPDILNTLIAEQTMGRHRAYALHRLALFDAGITEAEAINISFDSAAFQRHLKAGSYKLAYDMLAILPPKKRGLNRTALVATLHKALDNKPGQQKLALKTLHLIAKNTPQEKQLIAYLERVIANGQAGHATVIANSIQDGPSKIRAYYRLRDMYRALNMDAYAQRYHDYVKQTDNAVIASALDDPPEVEFEPFKKFTRTNVLFNQKNIRERLQPSDAHASRKYCLAEGLDVPDVGAPLDGFRSAVSNNANARMHAFSWYVMVHSSRALAGNAESIAQLKATLLQWAKANALYNSEETHLSHFHLKRLLFPTIIAASIMHDTLTDAENERITAWLEPLVRRMDKVFDGKVDRNNHRYMADAVLMAWGIHTGDAKLYRKGIQTIATALYDARSNGSLPMETVRGSRATWYMRQSLASLITIAEMAKLQGDDMYAYDVEGITIDNILSYFLHADYNPLVIFADSAVNYNPGYAFNIFEQLHGYRETRPQKRHYLAFAMLMDAHRDNIVMQRLRAFMQRHNASDRVMIDEFSGGNASCFAIGLQ